MSRQKRAPKWPVFQELRAVNVKYLFPNPEEAHPCAEPRRLTYYVLKSGWGRWLWAVGSTQKEAK